MMKVGIIGLPQSGKMTLFEILTGNKRKDGVPLSKATPGSADILDARFDALVSMYEPEKSARARIDLVLLPKMEPETIARGDIFRDIVDMDAICHVVRAFEDESVYHVDGSVDAVRDMDMVNAELLIHDQIFVEKRVERLEKALRKIKDEAQQKELALMHRMLAHLEGERPLRMMAMDADDEALIRSYPFITRKEMVLALNIGEDDIGTAPIAGEILTRCEAQRMKAMQVSAKVESEIAMLDTDEEKKEFMEDLGISEMALETLTRLCLEALGLVSFFTVGKDEVRQWLVRRNSPAPVAAGVIHSDLQRGFIRAEVMKYEELMACGDEAVLKKAGKMYLNGKEYIVEDGDILNIRFKV
ncbi:DUF933 domain-containing protein [Desulfoluna spongiiphila]|uniref:DUF933 domain-containing protein n=1 Tax=Desulfoluna spongiiphila TaxID=419481 RepID=UPI0012586E8A|nr:DUF933 domain-containing protein [Desulfoluna spongiiphila]VVS95250.1 tgs-like [Desulfoluna spongiiphila]